MAENEKKPELEKVSPEEQKAAEVKTETTADIQKNKKSAIIVGAIFAAVIIVVVLFVVLNGKSSSDSDEIDPDTVEFEVYTDAENENSSTSDWPASDIFPDVPVFESSNYDVTDEGTKMTIVLGANDYQNLDAYLTKLTDAGAELQVKSDVFAVYTLGDVEIQITRDKNTPMITLCGEDAVEISVETFADFPLPENGRMVDASLSDTNDKVFYITERCLSYEDALAYCERLEKLGWETDSDIPKSGENKAFLAQFTLDDMSISIDYHEAGYDCQIILTTDSASAGITDSDSETAETEESEESSESSTVIPVG